jgi:DNA-3-methyladenine glycosylase
MKILKCDFYDRDTATVAQELLGKIIVRIINEQTVLKVKIVETEAYLGILDMASHAYGGKRVRNAPLYGPVGHAYIYFIYGMYYCLNVVSRDTRSIPAGGTLIRAVEPLEGIEYMEHKRHGHSVHNLTNGPGKLTQALSINKNLNGHTLMEKGPLYVLDAPNIDVKKIKATPRIGISHAKEELLRFYIINNPFVSKR